MKRDRACRNDLTLSNSGIDSNRQGAQIPQPASYSGRIFRQQQQLHHQRSLTGITPPIMATTRRAGAPRAPKSLSGGGIKRLDDVAKRIKQPTAETSDAALEKASRIIHSSSQTSDGIMRQALLLAFAVTVAGSCLLFISFIYLYLSCLCVCKSAFPRLSSIAFVCKLKSVRKLEQVPRCFTFNALISSNVHK